MVGYNSIRKFSFSKIKDTSILSSFSYEKALLQFQLDVAQFELHREHFGRADERVADFVPDAWQIKLIDAIDANKSCVVVAPTSSGKTFASFYAFEKILKNKADTSSSGVVVYVAPAKSLINQMTAAIYSKYKHIDPGRNKHLIGVFTRDYVENINTCRILLTVPECLEIIYFSSTAFASGLTKNIRYIVFDEFQNMNDENRGRIWERVALFCACPFLALSATINNPTQLTEWLNESKKAFGETILIEYKQPSTEYVYNVYNP
jgi:ATP-dependent RNA helicase DDX60